MVEFEVLHALPQVLHAVFRSDNKLARKSELRLRDCISQKLVLPSSQYGVRHLLELAATRKGYLLTPVVETESFELIRHFVSHENAIGFQIPVGLNPHERSGITHRPLSDKDLPAGRLILGQRKGRALPVASGKFSQQIIAALG